MLILNKLMILVSIVLLILCVLAPVRKHIVFQKNSVVQKVLGPHIAYGILLFVTTLVHGILSGNKAGMMTGKLAWLCLAFLLCLSALKRKMKKKRWLQLHRGCTVCLCILTVIHIMHAMFL